jgi:hypothetical protein
VNGKKTGNHDEKTIDRRNEDHSTFSAARPVTTELTAQAAEQISTEPIAIMTLSLNFFPSSL